MEPINPNSARSSQAPQETLTLLFDGDCPICAREVAWLKRRDRQQRLTAVDISTKEFRAEDFGRSQEELMNRMHAVLPDGSLIDGVEVFRQAYARVGLGWLLAPTRLPVLRQLSDAAYALFARYRLRIGRLFRRSCSGDTCR